MIATVTEIGAIEIVSTVTGITTPVAVIERVLAHLNMIHTLQSVGELSKIEKRDTGTMTAQACLHHRLVVNDATMIDMSALVAALEATIMVVSVVSATSNVSDPMSVGPTPEK